MARTTSKILRLLALSATLASATPPACLLAAVNTEPNPSDLSIVCGADSSKVMQQISSLCNGSSDTAMSAYTSICSASGFSIATAVPDSYATSILPSATKPRLTLVTVTATDGSSDAQATALSSTPVVTGGTGVYTNGTYTKGASAPTGSTGVSVSPSGYDANSASVLMPRHMEAFASLALVAAGFVLFL